MVTYIPGAPDVVNAPFLSQLPEGEVPAGTPVIVVR